MRWDPVISTTARRCVVSWSPSSCYANDVNKAAVRLGSFRLDVGRPDHLGPLLGLVGDELAEIGGGTGERRTSQIEKPRFDPRIGEGDVDFSVELVDDIVRRRLGRGGAPPVDHLVAGHKIGD